MTLELQSQPLSLFDKNYEASSDVYNILMCFLV